MDGTRALCCAVSTIDRAEKGGRDMAMLPVREGWGWRRPGPWVAGRLLLLALVVNLGLVAVLVLLATRLGFAPASTTAPAGDPPGFLPGLWHGLVLPIAFVVSFFRPGVGLYATVHDGHAYDAGFVLGLLVILRWPLARVTRTVHHHHHHHVEPEPPWPPPLRPGWTEEPPHRSWPPGGHP